MIDKIKEKVLHQFLSEYTVDDNKPALLIFASSTERIKLEHDLRKEVLKEFPHVEYKNEVEDLFIKGTYIIGNTMLRDWEMYPVLVTREEGEDGKGMDYIKRWVRLDESGNKVGVRYLYGEWQTGDERMFQCMGGNEEQYVRFHNRTDAQKKKLRLLEAAIPGIDLSIPNQEKL